MKPGLSLKVAVFTLLCLLSVAAHLGVEQYRAVGGQLLANSDFGDGLEKWQIKAPRDGMVSLDGGEIKIQAGDSTASPRIYQRLPAALLGKTVVLRATAKAVNISGGEKSWDGGRILFVQYRQGQAIYSASHRLARLEGTNDWQEYTAFFHIQPGITEARVMVVLNRAAGELYCRDLSLFQAEANHEYILARWSILAGWFLFALVLFGPVLVAVRGSTGRTGPVLTILTVAGIIVGTTMPGSWKEDLKVDVIEEVRVYSEAMSAIDITKLAHFGLFGLLTFLLFRLNSPARPLHILADLLMLACGTELAQLFIENRGTHLADVAVDLAGCAAGLMLWLAFRWYAHHRIPRQPSSPAGG